MKEQESAKYERALDASMLIALGKLMLFNECWEYVRWRARKKVRRKKLESLRVALRERVNSLPDTLFFIRPEKAISEESVRQYFQKKFESEKLAKKIADELRKRVQSATPGLAEFLST
jgi:hypothetical protein